MHNSELSRTVVALIDQAKAAENLGDTELSLEYYQLAIESKPLKGKILIINDHSIIGIYVCCYLVL